MLRSLTVPSSLNVNKEEVGDTTGQGDIESPGIFGESPIQTPDVRNSVSLTTPPSNSSRNSFKSLEKKEASMISTGQSSLSKKRQNTSFIPISKRNRTTSMNKDDQVDKTLTNISAKGPDTRIDNREVIVETGPVESTISNYQNDEGEDEYEEEEDEMPQSAAELLSKHRGDDGAALSDYEEEYY